VAEVVREVKDALKKYKEYPDFSKQVTGKWERPTTPNPASIQI